MRKAALRGFVSKVENNRLPEVSIIETATGIVICSLEKISIVQSGKWSGDSRHLLYSKALGQELWQYDVYADKNEKIADFRPNAMYAPFRPTAVNTFFRSATSRTKSFYLRII